jgi:hypothetical protein
MSCPGTIIVHNWHDKFEGELNAFLAATRSVPDIITKQLGYDARGLKLPWYLRWLPGDLQSAQTGTDAWVLSVTKEEKKRRRKFHRKFEKKFIQFRRHPLSNERHEVMHRSGLPHWEVRVKGTFKTYIGGPMNPLPPQEDWPVIPREDPAFWALADTSPRLLEALRDDFYWVIPQPDGTIFSLPLFEECRNFLQAANDLVEHARQLYQAIHQGHALTSPPW